MGISKKRLLSMIRHDKSKLMWAMRIIILSFVTFIVYCIVTPYFSPRIVTKTHVKEVTALLTRRTIESVSMSLKSNEFQKLNNIVLEYDNKKDDMHFYSTNMQKVKGNDFDLYSISNNSMILFGSKSVFKVPKKLPALPKKNMVIGFTFAQCHPNNYALVLPDAIDACMITKESLVRFIEFNKEELKGKYDDNEAFRIFTDLHSLKLLMLPCGDTHKMLPSWETIEVIENENNEPFKPWGNIEKIPEVWKIKDLV